MKLEKKHWIVIGVVVAIILVWYFFLRKKKTESGFGKRVGSTIGVRSNATLSTGTVGTTGVGTQPQSQIAYNCTHTETTCDEGCAKSMGASYGQCPPDCVRTNTTSYTGMGGCKSGDKGTPRGTN